MGASLTIQPPHRSAPPIAALRQPTNRAALPPWSDLTNV